MDTKSDEPPHFVEASIGNRMDGGDYPAYWRQFLFCSDGTCVCGACDTPDEATRQAHERRNERESFIVESSHREL